MRTLSKFPPRSDKNRIANPVYENIDTLIGTVKKDVTEQEEGG